MHQNEHAQFAVVHAPKCNEQERVGVAYWILLNSGRFGSLKEGMTASPKMSLADRGLAVGDTVGRFVVKQALAQSPHSAQFLVEHAILGYRAALRLVSLEAGSDVNLALLNSPYVPTVYAKGELDGAHPRSYVVEELVTGDNLAQTLRVCRRLQPALATRMTLQLLSALQEAHGHGIVHGAISPDNVIVADEYTAACERFVLVNFRDSRSAAPPASGVMNRAFAHRPYTAPEVRDGAQPRVQSDIFSLGCVLFETITGEYPQWDGSGRLVRQVAEVVPSHPDLSRIVAKALAPEPRARFETAQDMATVLLAVDVDELCTFGVAETTELHGPAETVDTVDMTRPRSDLSLPESLQSMTVARGKPALLSTTRPRIWFFSGDPGLDTPQVRDVVTLLRDKFDVQVLDGNERERRQGQIADAELPWVVVFGDLHALVDEPLLRQLSARGETARVLVSTHNNVDLLSATVNATGLDAHECISDRPEQLANVVEGMVERIRVTRIQYDGLRLAVADAHVDVERLQQCFERKTA